MAISLRKQDRASTVLISIFVAIWMYLAFNPEIIQEILTMFGVVVVIPVSIVGAILLVLFNAITPELREKGYVSETITDLMGEILDYIPKKKQTEVIGQINQSALPVTLEMPIEPISVGDELE